MTWEAGTQFPVASHVWVRREGGEPFEGVVSYDNRRWQRDGQLLVSKGSGGCSAWYALAELSPVRFPATEPWSKPLRPMVGRGLIGPGFSPLGKVDPVIGRIVSWEEDGRELRGQVWDEADASFCPVLTAKERRARHAGRCWWIGVAQGRAFAGEFRMAYTDKRDGTLHMGSQPYGADGRPIHLERQGAA